MRTALLLAVALSALHLTLARPHREDIDTCLIGRDVILITDVRTDDVGQTLKLLDFFSNLASSPVMALSRFLVMSYPHIFVDRVTGIGHTTFIPHEYSIQGTRSFIWNSIRERNAHPDFNVVLSDVNNILNKTTTKHIPKTVLVISYNRYVPPASSEESEEPEEALETPSRVKLAQLADSIKEMAQVLIYGIGTFDNMYELYDLATCQDERCIFELDDFGGLSLDPLFDGCTPE